MPAEPVDPQWPKLLSLAVHEFRTPMTVVSGYIRMLLKERAGTVTDEQRRLLEEAEKSCTRLSSLLAELSDLSRLEAGQAPFNRARLDLRAALRRATAALPPLPDREIAPELDLDSGEAPLEADAARLEQALTAIIGAVRREIVTADRFVIRERQRTWEGRAASWIAIAEPARIDHLAHEEPARLGVFDEWRGGVGLGLAVARRIVQAHGGTLWSPASGGDLERRAGAVIALPLAG